MYALFDENQKDILASTWYIIYSEQHELKLASRLKDF